jgi:glycosyltransferase involved in cell wall biosynthesis
MLKILVSIIIPVYNEEEYLNECINSIQKQTFQNFECLFINDGSTDKSCEIIKNYGKNDSRFKLITKEHSGLIPSINLGLKKAEGKIICRMDGDDIMPGRRLELQVKKLIQCGSNSLITGKVKYISNENITSGYKEYENWLNSLNNPHDFIKNCFIECPVAAPSWMMYKAEVEKLKYFDDNIYPEDYNFMLKALINDIKFYSIPEEVLLWRDYPTRTSKILTDYNRGNFRKVRAIHLPNFIKKFTNYKSIVIFGVGSSGKNLCKALQQNNSQPKLFVDTHPDRIGKTILNIPVCNIQNSELYKDSYILIALRDKTVKRKLDFFLKQLNKSCITDYIYCC